MEVTFIRMFDKAHNLLSVGCVVDPQESRWLAREMWAGRWDHETERLVNVKKAVRFMTRFGFRCIPDAQFTLGKGFFFITSSKDGEI